MVTELRNRNAAQQIYVRALTSAWRSGVQVYDPSVWLARDPEAEEKMLRDADIAHAVQYRCHAIAGRQWQAVPRVEKSPRAHTSVMVATELLGCIKHFTRARLNLSRAFLSGARFGRIHGETVELELGDGKVRTWWVPRRIEDVDKRLYRIVPDYDPQKQALKSHWERWNIAKGEWEVETVGQAVHTIRHVYQDDQASLGYGRGLREALGWWWYAKEHVFAESLQAVERFAQGILTAKVDGVRDADTGLPNTELINAWQDVLENLRARHVVVYDKNDTIEHISMDGSGWELLRTVREELRSTIFTLVMGANLTTSANEGGSYALAEVQENSTETLIQFDREILEETLTDDLIGCIWQKNAANLIELGIYEHKPRFSITQEKRLDPEQRVRVAQALYQMGVDLSRSEVLEQAGFSEPDPGEEIIQGVTAPVGMPGFGGDLFSRPSGGSISG